MATHDITICPKVRVPLQFVQALHRDLQSQLRPPARHASLPDGNGKGIATLREITGSREPGCFEGDLAALMQIEDISVEVLDRRTTGQRDKAAALRRIESGQYGLCEDCKQPIPQKRLKANPFAACCIICEEERATAAAARRHSSH